MFPQLDERADGVEPSPLGATSGCACGIPDLPGYQEELQGSQFVVRNPNASTTCGCGLSFSI